MGPSVQPSPPVKHTQRDGERRGVGFFLRDTGGRGGVPLPAIPAVRRSPVAAVGPGQALPCAHPREVVAPPKTTYGVLATSTGGTGRRRQAVAGPRFRAVSGEEHGRCGVK
jgi:hypothetical protein